jgi:hypothetical protein
MYTSTARSKRAWHVAAGLVLALMGMQLVDAEPVVSPAPAQTTVPQTDNPQWIVDTADLATDFGESKGETIPSAKGLKPAETSITPVLPSAEQSNQRRSEPPLVQPPVATGQNFIPPDKPQATRDDPGWDQELRGNIKEAVRPLYAEAVDSVRSLQSELGLGKSRSPGESSWDENSPQSDNRAAAGVNPWETQGNRYESREPPRSAAQIENDKIVASVMMSKLIDDVKPWALGLLALYVLGYLIKGLLAYNQYRATRQVKKQTARALRKHGQ